MPMYLKLHNKIRKVDEAHILFFEPTVIITSVSGGCTQTDHANMESAIPLVLIGLFHLLQLPFKGFSSTGLTEGPGGRAYNDRWSTDCCCGKVLITY